MRHSTEQPDQLLAHPNNFRRHPGEQRDALRGSLDTLGWIKSVIVNEVTGHVLDGHARIEEALTKGVPVPVDWVRLSEDEERIALAVLDPISAMATHDVDALRDLLDNVTVADVALQALINRTLGEDTATVAAAAHADPMVPDSVDVAGQAGVIVICRNETEQRAIYERLTAEGLDCRVVNT